MPYVETTKNLKQEHDFATFLDKNKDYIDWWYKNDDEGRMHYAIEYLNPEAKEKRLFYVDFIIRLKNGDIYLFDTKGSEWEGNMESEKVIIAKHNALNDYVRQSRNPRLKVGSIIRKANNDPNLWRYCRMPISSSEIQPGWDTFFPDQLVRPV